MMRSALQYAREHKAESLSNPEYAAIHRNLRPALDARADLEACIDLDEATVVCKVLKSPWKKPAVLLFGALIANCNQGFCGYVIYPMQRTNAPMRKPR
jgi:hypothetical protein